MRPAVTPQCTLAEDVRAVTESIPRARAYRSESDACRVPATNAACFAGATFCCVRDAVATVGAAKVQGRFIDAIVSDPAEL